MSTTINSAQYTQLLTQLSSQFDMSNTSASSYLYSIWGISADIDGLTNGEELSSSQKESIIMDLMQRGFGLVMGLFNQSGKAKQEVDGSKERINNSKNNSNEVAKTSEEQLQEIINDINNNDIAALNSALEKMNSLTGEQFEQIKTKVAELKAQIQTEIDEIKSEVEEGKTDDIQTHLDNIDELRINVQSVIAEVDNIVSQLFEQVTIVTDKETEIAKKEENAEQIIADSLNKIKENTVTASKEGGYNVTLEAKGEANVAEAAALEATAGTETAAGVFTFGISAAAGAVTAEKAADLQAAGTTRLTGGAQNLTNLGTALGEMGSDYSTLAGYTTNLGSAIGNAANIIGQFNTKVTPFIKSIGSYYTAVTAAVDDGGELAQNIENDKAVMENFTQGELQQNGIINESGRDRGKKTDNMFQDYTQNGILPLKTPLTNIDNIFKIEVNA